MDVLTIEERTKWGHNSYLDKFLKAKKGLDDDFGGLEGLQLWSRIHVHAAEHEAECDTRSKSSTDLKLKPCKESK